MKQALYYSIASAALAGLLTGGVMKLGPDALSEVGGPQILIAGAGERVIDAQPHTGGALFTSLNGEIPEYVVGTDWTRPQYAMGDVYAYDASYEEADSYAPTAPAPNPNVDDAVFVAPVKISSPPKIVPVSYPSEGGGVLGDAGEEEDTAFKHIVVAQDATSEELPS